MEKVKGKGSQVASFKENQAKDTIYNSYRLNCQSRLTVMAQNKNSFTSNLQKLIQSNQLGNDSKRRGGQSGGKERLSNFSA
mmetsp:Transcript_2909/g.2742  ORF Transcript_2909/g.2742 Transcript_2909/m.2742 type:complete len:81 (-) Transcript_2909:50-292(-)